MDRKNEISIVVLVGPIGAGKGTAVQTLINFGYVPFNYGDIIYEERTARGLSEERKNSNLVGSILRKEFGNDIISKKLSERILDYCKETKRTKILVDGLRHPSEVHFFKSKFNTLVIGVTADSDIRFERIVARNRDVDPKKFKDFKIVDAQDRGFNAELNENQSDKCLEVADFVIVNNFNEFGEYKKKILEVLKTAKIVV